MLNYIKKLFKTNQKKIINQVVIGEWLYKFAGVIEYIDSSLKLDSVGEILNPTNDYCNVHKYWKVNKFIFCITYGSPKIFIYDEENKTSLKIFAFGVYISGTWDSELLNAIEFLKNNIKENKEKERIEKEETNKKFERLFK